MLPKMMKAAAALLPYNAYLVGSVSIASPPIVDNIRPAVWKLSGPGHFGSIYVGPSAGSYVFGARKPIGKEYILAATVSGHDDNPGTPSAPATTYERVDYSTDRGRSWQTSYAPRASGVHFGADSSGFALLSRSVTGPVDDQRIIRATAATGSSWSISTIEGAAYIGRPGDSHRGLVAGAGMPNSTIDPFSNDNHSRIIDVSALSTIFQIPYSNAPPDGSRNWFQFSLAPARLVAVGTVMIAATSTGHYPNTTYRPPTIFMPDGGGFDFVSGWPDMSDVFDKPESLAAGKGAFIAIGRYASTSQMNGWRSTDGNSWTRFTPTGIPSANGRLFFRDKWFFWIPNSGSSVYWSDDGIAWQACTIALPTGAISIMPPGEVI